MYQGKTNWTKDDIVKPDDLNRIEQGIEDAQSSIDNISQSLTPEAIGAAKQADLDILTKHSVSIKTSTSKDFNTYREPGLFFVGSISEYTNAPSTDGGFSWGILRVESLGSTAYVKQTYTCVLNNATFVRAKAEDTTGREWEPWRRTVELDKDGILRLNSWMDIRGDASTINSYGKTHAYHAFLVNNERSGYVGSSDPNAPGNMALVSDKADVVISAKNNVWLNASAGAVHLNGRNVLWELDQVKQSGVDAKQRIVDALNAKGIAASTSESWNDLTSKVNILRGRHDTIFQAEGLIETTNNQERLIAIGTIPAGATQVIFNNIETSSFNSSYVNLPKVQNYGISFKLQVVDRHGKVATLTDAWASSYDNRREIFQSLTYSPGSGELYRNIGSYTYLTASGFESGLRKVDTLDTSGTLQIRLSIICTDVPVQYRFYMTQTTYL